jgi:WhiB family transcriptional regulator, redox-sensing transcriptional regulator
VQTRVLETTARPEWMKDAACTAYDPDWWFPGPREHEKRDRALAICAQCPVRPECLAWSFLTETDKCWGVLGGKTAHQRTAIRNRMNRITWTPFALRCITGLVRNAESRRRKRSR